MNYTHVAHDCVLGDRNVLANGVQLGGHVTLQDWVVIGALSGIHQFARIGESAMVGAGSMVSLDVVPFCNATGDRADAARAQHRWPQAAGLSTRGRRGDQARLPGPFSVRASRSPRRSPRSAPSCGPSPEVERLVSFVEDSKRGICR